MNSKITDTALQTLLGTDQTALHAASSFGRTASLQFEAQREALRLAMEPTDSLRRYLRDLNLVSPLGDTLTRYNELTRGPLWHAQEAARSFTAGFAQQLESMRAALLPATQVLEKFSAHRETFDAMQASSNFASQNIRDLLGKHPGEAIFKQAETLGRSYNELLRSFEQFKEPASLAALRTFSESIAHAANHAGLDGLDFGLGDVEADSDLHQRAANAIQAITIDAEAQPSLQAAVDRIITAIEATKEPVLQKLLWFVLLPFLFLLFSACLNPVADFYIKQHLEEKSKQGATKAVKEVARETFGNVSVLRDYRFIGARRLIVRSAPGARAPEIGHLRFGQLVQILQRSGDFTLIAWRSTDSDAEIQGWVFSRYLKRFD